MHPNPVFRRTSDVVSFKLARDIGFGTLCANGDSLPHTSHIPFVLDDRDGVAFIHLVRSNPIARLASPADAVLTVVGPQGYISPDWYHVEDQVPTWNYVAVRLEGRLMRLPDDALEPLLAEQSLHFERRIPGKVPWTLKKLTEETKAKLYRQILPFRLEITRVDSTWKLGQNKPDAARNSAADYVEGSGAYDAETLAGLMRTPPDVKED